MDTVNELRKALARGSGREQVSEILDRLIEFTRMHFWSEEQLLEHMGFPGLDGHRAEHHRLLAEMMQSAHLLQYGPSAQTGQLLGALRDGYLEDIENLDRQYGPWLNERGVD